MTPIPDSGDENSLMILNGIHGQALNIQSEYWDAVDYDSLCKDSEGELTGRCFDNGVKVKHVRALTNAGLRRSLKP